MWFDSTEGKYDIQGSQFVWSYWIFVRHMSDDLKQIISSSKFLSDFSFAI